MRVFGARVFACLAPVPFFPLLDWDSIRSFSAFIFSRRIWAGSSLGFWGTSCPRKAFARRSVWRLSPFFIFKNHIIPPFPGNRVWFIFVPGVRRRGPREGVIVGFGRGCRSLGLRTFEVDLGSGQFDTKKWLNGRLSREKSRAVE